MADSPNIDLFNQIVGSVFGDLYEAFPVPRDLRAYEYAIKMGLHPDPTYIDTAQETPVESALAWLLAEGFIRTDAIHAEGDYIPRAVLTHKGLQLLSLPSSLGNHQSIGSELVEVAKKTGAEGLKDLGKKAILEVGKLSFQLAMQAVLRPS